MWKGLSKTSRGAKKKSRIKRQTKFKVFKASNTIYLVLTVVTHVHYANSSKATISKEVLTFKNRSSFVLSSYRNIDQNRSQ